MPVPVSATNPRSRGADCHVNKVLPVSGDLFANLGAHSAEQALQDKKVEQAVHWKDRRAAVNGCRDAQAAQDTGALSESVVVCHDLTFAYHGADGLPCPGPPVLSGLRLKLDRGARLLLVGANGAGKTSLLKVLAGHHMVAKDQVRVLGEPPFHTTSLTTSGALSYIGGSWTRDIAFAGYSVPLTGDFPASQMLDSVAGADPARRRQLVHVLDIDESWRMHTVSDGQRRRVQIACGLLRPARVLLLDEVTVDLDVLVREDLMNFLKQESEERGCTIIYITHIFDGIEDWPTHLGLLADGKFESVRAADDVPELRTGHLMELVEAFLRRHKRCREEARARGEHVRHPESRDKPFRYIANNGYASGRLVSTVAR